MALLKELGAAKSLGTLIEGESLLNDGSAVVLYVFVKNMIGYDHATDAPPSPDDPRVCSHRFLPTSAITIGDR